MEIVSSKKLEAVAKFIGEMEVEEGENNGK